MTTRAPFGANKLIELSFPVKITNHHHLNQDEEVWAVAPSVLVARRPDGRIHFRAPPAPAPPASGHTV